MHRPVTTSTSAPTTPSWALITLSGDLNTNLSSLFVALDPSKTMATMKLQVFLFPPLLLWRRLHRM